MMPIEVAQGWTREPGPRVEGTRDLDASKVQAPGIIARPEGGFRLFYTAVGPGRPYPECQGYILSAISEDGLDFAPEPGIRLAPDPAVEHMYLRLLAPSIVRLADGRWRMYVEARGTSDRPTVITSAVSDDLLGWQHESGVRLATPDGLGGPRLFALPGGRCRLLACGDDFGDAGRVSGKCIGKHIISAISDDGLDFTFEPGERIRSDIDAVHAEDMSVITLGDGRQRMYYAACDSDGRWRIASAVSDS